jgi:SAM-dependent methyltransferase
MKKKEPLVFKTFEESFRFYEDWKYSSNEYFLHPFVPADVKKIPTQINTIINEQLFNQIIELGNNQATLVVKDFAIQRFHPNTIDNKKFWKRAKYSFPHISICGAPSKNFKEVNRNTLEMSKQLRLFPVLLEEIQNSQERLKILEIGFGHGNIFNEIHDKCEYLGIDYTIPRSLRKYKNFIEIDKSGIPDYLQGEQCFDIIYSVNVLQHCSQKDRFEYFEQGYSALKPGGYFMFSCFLMNKANENDACWGIKDHQGRGYTHFFNQLTEIDTDTELIGFLRGLGYVPVNGVLTGNCFAMIIQKPK